MIYYDRIDVSKGINDNNTNASKECDVLAYSSKFQPNICNRCHSLMMSINLCDIAILNIKH